jgi:hypothetical protein
MPLAPKAPGARSAPDEFLSIYSPFNLISNPLVRSGCSAQPGGPSLLNDGWMDGWMEAFKMILKLHFVKL